MRNLKRALSLTLASVMLLGMMVVGSSAAGFPDVDEEDNVEAIEVLNAVDVIRGYDNGDFGPDDLVTRSQMAVIMANLLKLDYQYYEASCPFTDVPAWARGYVGACYANGITSGYSATIYGSDDGITPVQAASMMMRALGYFKYAEDYKAGFEVATVSQGSQVGIFKGVGSSATAQMTRDQVAKMALNALESEMVTFTGTPGIEVNGVVVGYRAEYTPRTSTEIKYQAIERRTSDVSGGNNLNRGQYYIQLGEELYDGDLVKREDTDDFERPSNTWLYKSKEIGTYVDYDLLVAGGTYTDEVKYADLYDLITYTTIRDYDLNMFVDGVAVEASVSDKDNFRRSNNNKVGGRGMLTEVFVDQYDEEITITSINTYLAKANTSYSTTTETASLKVYTKDKTGMTYSVDVDDVPEIEGVEKDAFMLVYMSGKDGGAASVTDYSRFAVVDLFDTEILSDTEVTKFTTHGTKVVDKLTTGGTEYKTNPKAYYDKDEDVLGEYNEQLLSDATYNVYLDRYSNVIGVDLYEGNRNYVFITGFDRGTSHISTKTADAAAIFLDGTMETITVNVTDTDKNIKKVNDPYFGEWMKGGSSASADDDGNHSENRWYTYTQTANGNYTLKPATRMFATDYNYDSYSDKVVTLDSANLYVEDNGVDDCGVYGDLAVNASKRIDGTKGRAYGEDESVYITVETGLVDTTNGVTTVAITDVQGVYKGAQDVKMDLSKDTQLDVPNAVYTLYDSDNYIIAAIVAGEARGASASYAYITSDVKSERVEKNSGSRANDYTYYWEFEAFYNGEVQLLTAKTDYPPTKYDLDKYTVRELRFNGEYVSDVAAPKASKVQNTNQDNARIDDMDVYDVGHITLGYTTNETNWPGYTDDLFYVHPTNTKTGGPNDTTEANGFQGYYENVEAERLEGTIYLQGRTLYIEQAGKRDVGLALGRGIPALLVQNENRHNNDPEKRVYSSVEEAVNNIADCDTNTPGTQFRGRIAAALDGKGVAQWIVIISDKTLWTGKDPNYNVTTSYLRWVQWDVNTQTGRYWELYIPGYEDATTVSSETIRNALANNGCSDISRNGSNWNFYRNGTRYENQVVRVVTTYWGDGETPGGNVTISSVNPTLPTVTTLADGTTLPTASAEANANYDVSITWKKDGADYTGDTVNGAGTYDWTVTLTAKNGYTFANGVQTVYTGTVTVEKQDPGAVEVTVNSGYVNILKDGKIISQIKDKKVVLTEAVKKGDTITVSPAEAVEIKSGLAEDGTVDGNITIGPKDGYLWNPFARQWEGPDGALIGEIIEWPLASASRFSIRRSVVRSEESEGEETVLDWQNDENWFAKAIAKGLRIELRATVNGKEAVVNVVKDGSKYKFVEKNAGDKAAIYGLAEDDPDAVTSVGISEGTSATIFATGIGAWTSDQTAVVFQQYAPELKDGEEIETELTKAQIAKALNEAAKTGIGGEVTFSEDNITIADNGKVTAVGSNGIKFETDAGGNVPTRVYKVTWPGNGVGYTTGAQNDEIAMTGIPKTMGAVIDETYNAGGTGISSAVTVAEGAATGTASVTLSVATKRDINFVEAIVLDSRTNDTDGQGYALVDGKVTDWVKTDGTAGTTNKVGLIASVYVKTSDRTQTALVQATHKHVRVGAKIYFTQPATGVTTFTEGQTVTLKVNGTKDLKFTVNEAGSFNPVEDNFITVAAADAKKKMLTLQAIVENAAAEDINVYVDNVLVPESDIILDAAGERTAFVVNGLGEGNETAKKLTLVYLDDTDPENPVYKEISTAPYPDATGTAQVAFATITALAKENKVELFRAWTVTEDASAVAGYYFKYDPANPDDDTKTVALSYPGGSDDEQYFRIIDKGTAANKILVVGKDGEIVAKVGAETTLGQSKVQVNGSAKGVWEYEVTENIPASTFVGRVTVAEEVTVAIDAGEITKGTAKSAAITGLGTAESEDTAEVKVVSFSTDNADGTDLAGCTAADFTVKKTSNEAKTFTVTFKPADGDIAAAVAPSARATAYSVGTLTVSVEGNLVEIELQRTPA